MHNMHGLMRGFKSINLIVDSAFEVIETRQMTSSHIAAA